MLADQLTVLPHTMIQDISWPDVTADLWRQGYSRIGRLLGEEECLSLQAAYTDPSLFRKRIDMEKFRFGKGEYKYFSYPLPPVVAEIRTSLYSPLALIAGDWMAALKINSEFPARLDQFLDKCKDQGQTRPTPLMLHYTTGGYNCLHQDMYGNIFFPFQVVICLSRAGVDFTGGELLLVEQRPRAQSIGRALNLEQGEAVVITTRYLPVQGTMGFYRAQVRHGVSTVLSGERFVLGIIFHDAA